MPRRKGARVLSLSISPEERVTLDTMKAKLGVDSDANLLRVACWSLADEQGLECARGVFDLHTHEGVPTPTARPATPKAQRARTYARVAQPTDHPWKQPYDVAGLKSLKGGTSVVTGG